jgi:TRAP-type mannitol/chloroaromatic compound transport system permease small subunit
MTAIANFISRLSYLCGAVAGLACLGLILVTMYEVLARYLFRAPTVWAYDVAYMLNGAAFIMACSLALYRSQHVSVDILSQFFSEGLRRKIEIVVFTLLIFPAFGLLCYSAWSEVWKSWITGEIEQVSPWQPKIWPFNLTLAIGLTALWLQVLGRILKAPEPTESTH